MKYKITPDLIKELGKKDIFVFGSNMSGLHRGGAAAAAVQWGAETGVEEGCAGQTYAIPTMGEGALKTLTTEEIKPYVVNFMQYAIQRPNYNFYVTEIGCGIAGLTPKEVAPLFLPIFFAPNIYLPAKFWEVLQLQITNSMIEALDEWDKKRKNSISNWITRKFKAIWDS